jgi:hypothetical protein
VQEHAAKERPVTLKVLIPRPTPMRSLLEYARRVVVHAELVTIVGKRLARYRAMARNSGKDTNEAIELLQAFERSPSYRTSVKASNSLDVVVGRAVGLLRPSLRQRGGSIAITRPFGMPTTRSGWMSVWKMFGMA